MALIGDNDLDDLDNDDGCRYEGDNGGCRYEGDGCPLMDLIDVDDLTDLPDDDGCSPSILTNLSLIC